MKKTLIALMALAGIAAAETETTPLTLSAVFSTSNKGNTQGVGDYSVTFTPSTPLTLSFDTLTISGTTKNGEYTTDSAGSVSPTAIRPNANVCAGDSYTLTFTLYNSGQDVVDISSITLDVFGYNKSGNAHTQGVPYANFELTYKLPDATSSVSLKNTHINIYSSATAKFSMGENQTITLGANESIQLSLEVTKSEGSGSFVGLKGATFTGTTTTTIPEPTTATLSLLALAGLAARRRRK